MNQSQATDKYLSAPRAEQEAICLRAILHVQCEFCGAPPGSGCSMTLKYPMGILDWFAHCGRWMKYLRDEDLYEMLGPVRLEYKDVVGPGAAMIVEDPNDIGDLLG